MTIAGWGKVTPSQMYMLQLAGYVLTRYVLRRDYDRPGSYPDEERLDSMRAGLERLRHLTGEDFG